MSTLAAAQVFGFTKSLNPQNHARAKKFHAIAFAKTNFPIALRFAFEVSRMIVQRCGYRRIPDF